MANPGLASEDIGAERRYLFSGSCTEAARDTAREQGVASEILQRQTFSVDEVIFRVGDQPRFAYLIQSGVVNITIAQNGADEVVGTLKAGELLGEMALVDQQPRSATAVAKEPTTCIVITPQDFQRRLEKSDAFVRSMVRVLTQRLRKMTSS